MNTNDSTDSARLEAVQARLAFRLASALTEQTAQVSPDISERLRHAREQALARARVVRAASARSGQINHSANHGSATLSLGGGPDEDRWWNKLALVLPLVVLIAGLLLIQSWHQRNQISVAAEIDVSLLADDVPPDAYGDPGFLEFLKSPRD